MRAFDQPLFEEKLKELISQNTKNLDKGRLRVRDANIALSFNINEAYLMKLVDTDIRVLRDSFVPAVDEACREVQRSGGNDITSGFIGEELVPRVLAAINDRKAEIRLNLEFLLFSVVTPSNWCLPSVLAHLSREMNDFEKDLKDHYDIEIGQLERQEAHPSETPAPKPSLDTRQKPPLTVRELKIWAVIQRGVRGTEYCRELGNAGIAPLQSGIWKGCPRKYESAYLQGEPWRHRIQDEKSKVRRKAELAGLAKLASE